MIKCLHELRAGDSVVCIRNLENPNYSGLRPLCNYNTVYKVVQTTRSVNGDAVLILTDDYETSRVYMMDDFYFKMYFYVVSNRKWVRKRVGEIRLGDVARRFEIGISALSAPGMVVGIRHDIYMGSREVNPIVSVRYSQQEIVNVFHPDDLEFETNEDLCTVEMSAIRAIEV